MIEKIIEIIKKYKVKWETNDPTGQNFFTELFTLISHERAEAVKGFAKYYRKVNIHTMAIDEAVKEYLKEEGTHK